MAYGGQDDKPPAGITCGMYLFSLLLSLIGLFWWFVLLWNWIGLFWTILATIFLYWIPATIMYWIVLLAFGPLTIISMTALGRSTAGRLFFGTIGFIVALVLSAILVVSVVSFFST